MVNKLCGAGIGMDKWVLEKKTEDRDPCKWASKLTMIKRGKDGMSILVLKYILGICRQMYLPGTCSEII